MSAILVLPQTPDEMNLLLAAFKKMRINARVLSEDEKEDIGLAVLMQEVDRSETVDRETIMKKLNRA